LRTPHTLLSLAEAGHGLAIVASILPTHRYHLRVVRLTHRRKLLREPFAVLWDRRRALPAYAEDFGRSLAGHMREMFPISPSLILTAGRTGVRAGSEQVRRRI
jgi:DNA-binding transcriptional LysR family regulator